MCISTFRLSAFSRLRFHASRFGRDMRGVTAVEFGLVATPLIVFVLGIMTIGAQYMTAHVLEAGLETTARKLRTGEAQKAGITLADFRNMYCDAAGFLIKCDENLVIHINSQDAFADLPRVSCQLPDGRLAPSSGNGGDAIDTRSGRANKAVKVNVCYEWRVGVPFWEPLSRLLAPDNPSVNTGGLVLSAATAFRAEPFEEE